MTKRNADTILKTMRPDELIAWRERNGYTQVTLAEVLGVHPMTVSRWERSVHRKEIPPFLRLALERLECIEKEVKKVREMKNEKGE